MAAKRKSKNNDVRVEVEYSGKLRYPDLCVSCNQKVVDKTIPFTMFNTLYTRKIILNFPVCEDCYQAKKEYVNLLPIIIIGSVIFALSIFTIVNQPDYIPFSPAVHIGAGLVWLAIIVGYVLLMVRKAKKKNTGEVKKRYESLLKAVRGIKFQYSRKTHKKILVLGFKNESFAKEFKRMNQGNLMKGN